VPPLNISDSAIRMRHLFITHYEFGLDTFHFPWAQLTEFDGQSLPLNECFNIFRQCHNLSRLRLRSTGEYDGITRPRVLMPNLVSLELNLQDTDIGCMWNNLTLPRLQEANFSFFMGNHSWQKLELFALLDRSSCSLCTLHISNKISEEDLVECVERIPSLRNVNLQSCWGDGSSYPLPDRVSRMLEQRATSAMNVD
jgi:hypothetical protein